MKIALLRRNGLGDLLMTVPLIQLCREKYKGCHITLVVDRRSSVLTPYLKEIDEVIIIHSHPNKYISLALTAWKMRHRQFDLVISTRPTPMKWNNLFLSVLSATSRRAVVTRAWHSRWIQEPRPYEVGLKQHQAVKTLRILDSSYDHVPDRFIPRLDVKPSHTFSKPTLLVSLTNNRIGSQLDLSQMALILNRAHEKKEFQVILNCEPLDFCRAQTVARQLCMSHKIIPTPSFDEFLSLLASVQAIWSGDGGVMHLGAALDKPQLTLFGKTELWEWAPLSKKAICLRDDKNVNLIPQEEIQTSLEALIHDLR